MLISSELIEETVRPPRLIFGCRSVFGLAWQVRVLEKFHTFDGVMT